MIDIEIRKLWAKDAAKHHGWQNDGLPAMHDLGNSPRFECDWHETEYQVFAAGFRAALAAPQGEPVLAGRWHHGNGVLCSGSLRIARADFDTNPPLEMQERVFDDICETMNRNLITPQPAPTLEPPQGWKLVPVEPYPSQRIAGTAEWMRQCAEDDEPETDKTAAVYRTMVAAAPQPEAARAAKLKGGA